MRDTAWCIRPLCRDLSRNRWREKNAKYKEKKNSICIAWYHLNDVLCLGFYYYFFYEW